MVWHASTKPKTGLQAFDLMDEMSNLRREREENGTLPADFRAALQRIFGTRYVPMTNLHGMAMHKPLHGYDSG